MYTRYGISCLGYRKKANITFSSTDNKEEKGVNDTLMLRKLFFISALAKCFLNIVQYFLKISLCILLSLAKMRDTQTSFS